MKYLVLSDSHGNVDNMVRAVELVKPHGIIHPVQLRQNV